VTLRTPFCGWRRHQAKERRPCGIFPGIRNDPAKTSPCDGARMRPPGARASPEKDGLSSRKVRRESHAVSDLGEGAYVSFGDALPAEVLLVGCFRERLPSASMR
jgi:hypothetical protein